MHHYDPDRVIMQAASIEPDSKIVEGFVLGALGIVHAGQSDMVIGTDESALGWTFYTLSVDRSVIRRLASLPGGFEKVKGDSLEQKFVTWLNSQAKKRGLSDRMHFALASDLHSSRYGLF